MDIQRSRPNLEPPTCDDRPIWDAWMSAYQFPVLCVAVECGLFSIVARGPSTAAEIADALALGPRATEALLGVLAGMDFLSQHAGRFSLTDVSRNFLLPDSPYYWSGMLTLVRDVPTTYSALRQALERDRPIAYGEQENIFEEHELNPEQAKVFTAAMHSHSFPPAMGMARAIDFSGVGRVLDVAGGSGAYSIALAQRYPEMRCTVMELPVVCRLAEDYLATYGVREHVDTLGADMFKQPWPTGYDGVLFANIFHDWDGEHCRALCRRSFDCLPSGGRIYIHEVLLGDNKDGPLVATSFSVTMMLFNKGKQFTFAELEGLLSEAGFRDIWVQPTYGYYAVVSGTKP